MFLLLFSFKFFFSNKQQKQFEKKNTGNLIYIHSNFISRKIKISDPINFGRSLILLKPKWEKNITYWHKIYEKSNINTLKYSSLHTYKG